MFQFPRLPPAPYLIRAWVAGHDPCWVPPFGDLRIKGCLPLPAAYRSLPRPSSTSCAKASAVRLWYLPLAPEAGGASPPASRIDLSRLMRSELLLENSLSVIKHTFAIVMNRIVHDANTRPPRGPLVGVDHDATFSCHALCGCQGAGPAPGPWLPGTAGRGRERAFQVSLERR